MSRLSLCTAIIICVIAIFPNRSVAGVCPAVGLDTDCGVVITITDTGTSVSFTGQGPFDGIEDTLVGIVNLSSVPISSVSLVSGLPIFAFDGDGLSAYGVPGNANDPLGYGGPNAYFTNTTLAGYSGTVNFIVPVAAHVGIGFFSLEESIVAATACPDAINNAVSTSVSGATMSATFTPKSGYSLAQAEATCGFKDFDWQQQVLNLPLPNPFFQASNPPRQLRAPPPFYDPPPGGYNYPSSSVGATVDLSYPFYYDAISNGGAELHAHELGGYTLDFSDHPGETCLPGGTGIDCGGMTAPRGSYLAFSTHLAGVNADGTPTDLGIGFRWKSTFNGTSGGVSKLKNPSPVDPGSGTGGVTIIDQSFTTTYSGVAVTAVNGQQPGVPPALTSGKRCNGTYGGTFSGNIEVAAGQNCIIVNGRIVGSIHAEGGKLTLTQTAVTGSVSVEGKSSIVAIGPFASIGGNLSIEGLGSGTNTICSSTVGHNLNVENNAGSMQIGSLVPAVCDGNVIGGNASIESNSQVSVFANTVTGILNCESNPGATGGGNTAAANHDQCRLF